MRWFRLAQARGLVLRRLVALMLGAVVLGPSSVAQYGYVNAWGDNYNGQLGIGSPESYFTTPQWVEGLVGATFGIVAVSAGLDYSLALNSNGDVKAWGWNGYGNLGDNTYSTRRLPVACWAPRSVAVSAGMYHAASIDRYGMVWTWGSNTFGQLGDGTTTTRPYPLGVSEVEHATAVAAGGAHTLALQEGGTVWAWGNNADGELGDGTDVDRSSPAPIVGLNNIVSVSAGAAFSLALRNDGTVWAWGWNGEGELGNGSSAVPTRSLVPVQVLAPSGIVAISAGGLHALALRDDGTVWAWGHNEQGALGDGTYTTRRTPVQVPGLTNVVAISAGFLHSLAIRADGTTWAWGDNQRGQIGDGTTTRSNVPVNGRFPMNQPDGFVAISAGGGHSLAIYPDRRVRGSVLLRDFVGLVATQMVNIEIRTPGSTNYVQRVQVALDESGSFSFGTDLSGDYDVAVKGYHWLRKTLRNVPIRRYGPSGLYFELANGDATGDNRVNIADFLLFRPSFGTRSGSLAYDPRCDFNADGSINIADFLILRANFGKVGDP
ncbi:MAG: hypothetical protein KIS66_16360 [Fimbriimonadaceae bacterium]|nr:hypothetical protein [Fimbriimonadaceae bacterium]